MGIEIQLPNGTWVPLADMHRPILPGVREIWPTPSTSQLYDAAGEPLPENTLAGRWVDTVA
jgi:hypothetical protein